jgi:cytochrome c553
VEAPRPRGKPLAVMYSSNLLGEYEAHPLGGLARRATIAGEARGKGLVQVDAGDSLLPALEGFDRDRGELERRLTLMLDGLAQARLDALVPGETDLGLGPAKLKALAGKAGVPLVAANLLSEKKPWLPPDRLVRAAGESVGIFGLVDLAKDDLPHPLVQTDPVAAARAAVASLRERGARLVIALFHAQGGVEQARRLAKEVKGIDVVVVGHDGAVTTEPIVEGETRIVEAHRRGILLGRLDFDLRADGFDARNQIVRVEPRVTPEPVTKARITSYIEETKRRIDHALPAALGPAPAKQPEENWSYASNGACKLCHQAAVEQWEKTPHAAGLMTLQGKGRGRDPYCFGCHVTAFRQPGGTQSMDTAITYFNGVGCESCHGPSVLHVRANKATHTNRKVPESVCLTCHRDDQQPERFDYAAGLKLVLGPGHGDGGKGMR